MTTTTTQTRRTHTAPFEQATGHPAVTHRPADARFRTEIGWLHSQHSFAFGAHDHPANRGYRALRVINDDVVEPGQGFGEHPHRDMEILTWVLDGGLKHGDSLGNLQVLKPGELQAMTAGTGIRHSEFNASETDPVHFLQIWLMPRHAGAEPRYLQQSFDAAGRANRWQTLAIDDTRQAEAPEAMPIAQDASLSVADVDAGASVTVKVAPGRHGYVHLATGAAKATTADGSVDQPLAAGDALAVDNTASEKPMELTLAASTAAQALWFDLA
ncbi:MAG: pirin family protein [Planctomycetota bacterium]